MAVGLNLENLSKELSGAVSSSSGTDSAALASGIYKVLENWLGSQVYPIFISILIFVVVLFVFYGSFLYVTAYGDENRAARAKKTLTWAFIGLAFALIAFSATSYLQRILITKSAEEKLLEVPVKAP